jgi:hypothetical protein
MNSLLPISFIAQLLFLGLCRIPTTDLQSTRDLEEYVRQHTSLQEEVWEYRALNGKLSDTGRIRFIHSRDSNNNLIETITYEDNGKELDWWRYHVFIYERNRLTEKYYFVEDKLDNRLLDGKMVHEYSPEGLLSEIRMYDATVPAPDSIAAIWVQADVWQYQYDGNNRQTEQVSISEGKVRWRNQYEYDSFDRLVKEIFVSYQDSTLSETRYFTYDSLGNKLRSVQVRTYDSSLEDYRYRYEGKRMIEERGFLSEGKMFKRVEYAYNDAGDLIESRRYGWEDELTVVQRHRS